MQNKISTQELYSRKTCTITRTKQFEKNYQQISVTAVVPNMDPSSPIDKFHINLLRTIDGDLETTRPQIFEMISVLLKPNWVQTAKHGALARVLANARNDGTTEPPYYMHFRDNRQEDLEQGEALAGLSHKEALRVLQASRLITNETKALIEHIVSNLLMPAAQAEISGVEENALLSVSATHAKKVINASMKQLRSRKIQ